MSDAAELVFAPAKPGNEAWLIALVGPSGSGKTKSALRLARGIAGPNGTIGVADTENRRALFYAREYQFDHCIIGEPYLPSKYIQAAELSRAACHNVLIIDSMSHEWAGPGGILDWHEAELQRLAGDDYAKRERLTYTAWIRPKAADKAMMSKLLALNVCVIFCLRAEKKIAMEKNDKGKIVPVDLGFQPICGKNFMFDMTVSLMLSDQNPGVPTPIKVQDGHRKLFRPDVVLDEATGARIAAYARGDAVAPATTAPAATAAPAIAAPAAPPAEAPAAKPRRTVRTLVADIVARYGAAKTRAEHWRITDDPEMRERIDWLKKNKPEAFVTVKAAISENFKRTADTEGDGPPADTPTTPAMSQAELALLETVRLSRERSEALA